MNAQEQPKESTAGGDASPGLLGAWRRLGGRALELVQVRLALLGTEFEAEKLRWIQALVSAVLTLLLAAAALAMLSLGLMLLCPEPLRWALALGLFALYGGLAWWQWQRAQQHLSSPGGMFAASLAELARDREALEREDA